MATWVQSSPVTIHVHTGGNSSYDSSTSLYTVSADQQGDTVLGVGALSNGSEYVIYSTAAVTNYGGFINYAQITDMKVSVIDTSGSVTTNTIDFAGANNPIDAQGYIVEQTPLAGGGFVMVENVQTNGGTASAGNGTNYFEVFNNSGAVTKSWTEFGTAGATSSNGTMVLQATSGGGFVVAWNEGNGLDEYYQNYNSAGVAIGSPVHFFNAPTVPNPISPGQTFRDTSGNWSGQIAEDQNGYVMVGYQSNPNDVFHSKQFAIFDPSGNNILQETYAVAESGKISSPGTIESNNSENFIALSGGGFLATVVSPTSAWNNGYSGYNVYVQKISVSGSTVTFGTPALVEIVNQSVAPLIIPHQLSDGKILLEIHNDGIGPGDGLPDSTGHSTAQPTIYELIDPANFPSNSTTTIASTNPIGTLVPAGSQIVALAPDASGGVVAALQTSASGLTAQYLHGSLDASLYVADFDLIQAPSVSSIHISGSSPNNGSSEQFTVTFSESVTGVDLTDFATHVTGNVADTNISVSGSGATYTVTVNGVTGDGTLRLDLNGSGTGIKDAAGNAIATGFTAGDVYTIDHTAPAVTSVSVPANATYVAGQHLDFTVNLSEAVTVTGTPEIALTLDTGGTVDAQYISGSGTSALTFRYTVIGGEADLNGVSLGGAIILNGGTVKDAATNDAAPTLHNVADTSGVLVDSIPPPTALSINTVDSSPNNLNIEHFTVTFSNAVNGVDASDFTLVTSGTASGSIAAVSGSGTTWTVTVDNVTGDGTLRLDLNNTGDAITDNFGNTLTAAHTGDQSYTIDHTAPTETSVTAVADNGLADVGTGHVVTITLDTSEVVNVTGTPTFMLSDGGIATYTGGTGSNALTFSYTVVKGDNASDLHVTGYNGTIQDAAGNGLAPVSGDLALQIDGTAPAAPTVALLHDSGISATDHITNDPSLVFSTLALGDTFLFKVDGGSFSATAPDFTTSPLADGLHTVSVEEVDAVGNISDAASLSFTLDTIAPLAPTLVLANDTGVSNSDSLTNNPTITVTPAENGGTLLYKVDGASSFSATAPNFATDGSADGLHTVSVEQQDAAGNIGAATSLSFTLDTTAPAAPTVALLHDNGISATDHITNNPSFVFSTPALGDTFLYKEDSGSFSAVVPTFATDHSADGVHTVSVEQVDAAGNVSATTSLNFTLDTTPPHLTGITASPNSGNVFAGSTESFKFAFDEAVDVTGGTPTLTLNNGGTAVYDAVATAALHDATKLAFDYPVSSNDVPTTSLAVAGFIANGATVSDLAGNHADLTNVAATFATQINESSVPAYTIGGLTRPALELDSTGHIILDEAASSFAATYGIKSLYAGLPASTPYPPVADTHVTDFHLV